MQDDVRHDARTGSVTRSRGGRRRRAAGPLGFAIVLSLLGAASAGAHALAPSLLVVREVGAGVAEIEWKTPLVTIPGAELRPLLPADCPVASPVEIDRLETAHRARWRIECPAGSLVGATIGASGIADSRAGVVLRVTLADGRAVHALLDPDRPSLTVTERQSWISIGMDYFRLGVEHIAGGADHLLFVLGLLLLVPGARRLTWTLTAFTLGHSVTLSLAVLDLVRLPQSLAEVGIALSLFVLAVELARGGETRPPSGFGRRPGLMAASFGLLHGLGFAGALAEIGLPPGEIPLALLSFNVGIEAGQILFVILVAGLRFAFARAHVPWPARFAPLPAYAIGSLAAFWVFERLAGL